MRKIKIVKKNDDMSVENSAQNSVTMPDRMICL